MNSILKKLDRIIFLLEQVNSKLDMQNKPNRVQVPGRIARPVIIHNVRGKRIGIY